MGSHLKEDLHSLPDYENEEDEDFPPLSPHHSPGQSGGDVDLFANGEQTGEISKLDEAPVAKRRAVKRPQPKLDSQRLISERGLPLLRTLFDNVKFKGKGNEAEDLKLLMQHMEHWAHRLYPKLQFEDFINKLEVLGNKKEVQTCLKRIRMDMPLTHEDFITKPDEDAPNASQLPEEPDPFLTSTPMTAPVHSTPMGSSTLTDEQRQRIEHNKQLAMERRLLRLQQAASTQDQSGSTLETAQDFPEDRDAESDEEVGTPSMEHAVPLAEEHVSKREPERSEGVAWLEEPEDGHI
ncbi:TIMELESS-interacting protein [Erpetoichthys calabaricus]|uniref:TIMELESS-interacting protein n=1 Tax=Erpetoichthys calabaricus TaxID=27687 RepID=A0A8C4XEG5_ERPCA|nr:TIMELESS-interacting protein [Erpetoichthys calabaricus]